MPDLSQAYQEVKTLPDEVLARELAQPTGMIPGYLVMAEMEDRKAIRTGGGGQTPKTTSMKDELLQGLAQQPGPSPMGLPHPGPQEIMPQGMAQGQQMPQQMAQMQPRGYASGGVVGNYNPLYQQVMQMRNPGAMNAGMAQDMMEANKGYLPLNTLGRPGTLANPIDIATLIPSASDTPKKARDINGITSLMGRR